MLFHLGIKGSTKSQTRLPITSEEVMDSTQETLQTHPEENAQDVYYFLKKTCLMTEQNLRRRLTPKKISL